MKKIDIGTLVRLKFKSVRYSQYDLRSEKIERDEDKPVGMVIGHRLQGDERPACSEMDPKGNAEIGHPTGSVGYFGTSEWRYYDTNRRYGRIRVPR